MIRRFSAALIGLALVLPILVVAPVGAHTSGGLVTVFGTVTSVDGTTVAGHVTNHTNARRSAIIVTATWRGGENLMANETSPPMITNLAPHASSPFELFEASTVDPSWTLTVTATSAVTGTKPAGALSVAPGSFTSEHVYEGLVTNKGALAADDVQVYTWRQNGSAITDAAASGVISSIAAGASATYTINFDPLSSGTTVDYLVAKTNSGPFYTSWNNYFSDLGGSSFGDAIAWMADEGITTGCGVPSSARPARSPAARWRSS